uniref:ANK_REP_REGION domain-containing protein n=1 Tax=Macrostomum lignano TaxID=282301 RepID=A0A1I8J1W0_9PLAT
MAQQSDGKNRPMDKDETVLELVEQVFTCGFGAAGPLDFQRPTELLKRTRDRKFTDAIEFIRSNTTEESEIEDLIGLDSVNRTAVHYAAGCPDGEKALDLIVDKVGYECLLTPDEDGVTPLHLSARCHTEKQFEKNLYRVSAENCSKETFNELKTNAELTGLGMMDAHGDTIMHFLARNKAIQLTSADVSHWNLYKKNQAGQTVLQLLAANCEPDDVFEQFIDGNAEAELDSEGNTIWHYVAQNPKAERLMLEKIDNQNVASIFTSLLSLDLKNYKKKSILHVAAENYSLATVQKLTGKAGIDSWQWKDIRGDTISESKWQHYIDAIKALIGKKVSKYALNKTGLSFLCAANSGVPIKAVLKGILQEQEAGEMLFIARILSNSNGVHAIHAFSSSQELKELVEPLGKLSQLSPHDLLRLTVTGGIHKGATCLHFASRAEHRANIKYLKKKGLQLAHETDRGWTCIGFAMENYSLDQVKQNSDGSDKVETEVRTVMEMVEEAFVDDLFATDCVHNLVYEEWHNRLKKSNKVTSESCSTLGKGKSIPRINAFGVILVGFIVFMLYFAWYIVDFRTTFQYWSPDVVMLAYAASLTMQEVNEFLRQNRRVSLCGFRHCNNRRSFVIENKHTTEYRLNATVQILTLPFHLLFTNFDKIGFETTSSTESQDVGRVAHPDGFGWFNNLFMFVFLTLSNIVMLNLLIARFNLTVIRKHSRALGIWRRTYYEMLQEYKNISFLPPPFSFLEYPIRIIIRCKKQHIRRSKVGQKPRGYWSHESQYPEDYLEFLKFQAAIFREIRPKLLNEITRNKSDTEILKSHAVNVSATASQNLVEYLQRLETKIESMEEILSKRKKNRKANFHRKRDFDNEPEAAPDGLEKVESS